MKSSKYGKFLVKSTLRLWIWISVYISSIDVFGDHLFIKLVSYLGSSLEAYFYFGQFRWIGVVCVLRRRNEPIINLSIVRWLKLGLYCFEDLVFLGCFLSQSMRHWLVCREGLSVRDMFILMYLKGVELMAFFMN